MRSRAPFAAAAPLGRSGRDRMLRRYLASYGIDSPPRSEPERRDTAAAVAEALAYVARVKPRASIVHVLATPPDGGHTGPLGDALRRLTRRAATVIWSTPDVEPALTPPWDDPKRPEDPDNEEPARSPEREALQEAAPIAAEAVLMRTRVAQTRREAVLRRLGVRVARLRPARQMHGDQLVPAEPEGGGGAGA
jgi:hypothetical protein